MSTVRQCLLNVIKKHTLDKSNTQIMFKQTEMNLLQDTVGGIKMFQYAQGTTTSQSSFKAC